MLTYDDDTLYAALLARDPAYDGHAYVGVTSTGIFCRLTCAARKPKRENVRFFAATDAAIAAGFRACLRCRPLDPGRLTSPAVTDLRARVAAEPDRRWQAEDLVALGHDPSTARRAFQREYGMSFTAFVREQRLGAGMATLAAGGSVIEAQLEAGYDSASGFRAAISKLVGTSPASVLGRDPLTARWFETPIGAMLGIADDVGVRLLEFADRTALPTELERLKRLVGPVAFGDHPMLDRLGRVLEAYFEGRPGLTDIPLSQPGSAFSATVWAALRRIPSGTTTSYGALAATLGRPQAVRAVARANGANQIAILIPCHRVIGADGDLTGYGGKIWRKRWLLEHERRLRGSDPGAGLCLKV